MTREDFSSGSSIVNRQSSTVNHLTAGMNSHQLSKERQRSVKAVSSAMASVEELEDWMKRIEEVLSAPMPGDDVVKMALDHERAQTELASAIEEWERAVAYAEGIGAAV